MDAALFVETGATSRCEAIITNEDVLHGDTFLDMSDCHQHRMENLFAIRRELERDGVCSRQQQADILGTREIELMRILDGHPVSDVLAREIEWAMHKPDRWLDEDHRTAGQL